MITFSAPLARMRSARAAVRMPPPTRTRIGAFRQSCPTSLRVAPAAHGRVQVDDVKQGILSKPVQQTKNVFDREPQFAAVDQLYRAAILKVDAGDDQCKSV